MYILVVLLLFFVIRTTFAQGSEESRITEHNVVSLVALVGLLTISYFVRKRRKLSQENE